MCVIYLLANHSGKGVFNSIVHACASLTCACFACRLKTCIRARLFSSCLIHFLVVGSEGLSCRVEFGFFLMLAVKGLSLLCTANSFRFVFHDAGVMTGPLEDCASNCCAWSSIVGISTCYFVLAAPTVWADSPALPLISAALLLVTIGFLMATSFSDPGIIPRKSWSEVRQ